jgi:tryptophan halogenase
VAGWNWSASSPAESAHGAVYSSAHASSRDAISALPPDSRPAAEEISIRQGRWAEPWLGNCVAIGDSAFTVEPLEWANLHLVHSQIDRLISMMPGRDCAPVELVEYNRQSNAEADRIRDFVCMHYVTARRDEPFWKDAARMEPPDSLAHTLALFTERGRLPYYEEETFSRDSWLAVLLGQGLVPRRTDPLADIVPADEAVRQIASYRDAVRAFVGAQPRYHEAMSHLGLHA